MENKNLEMMKKLIEEKKRKGLKGSINQKPANSIGRTSKAFTSVKGGGVFDK